MRVWTLSATPPEGMYRPGNKQAPAAVVFQSLGEAEAFREAAHWTMRRVYELEIEGSFAESTTRNGRVAHMAFHRWHVDRHGTKRSPKCGVCQHWKPNEELAADALIIEATIIHPDLGPV